MSPLPPAGEGEGRFIDKKDHPDLPGNKICYNNSIKSISIHPAIFTYNARFTILEPGCSMDIAELLDLKDSKVIAVVLTFFKGRIWIFPDTAFY